MQTFREHKMNNFEPESIVERSAVAFYDVSGDVRSWGRRGILGGGIFGFALGIGFVAIPFTSDVLTFGVAGTLIVAAVEGAVIAGAFSAFAAALYGKGARRETGIKVHRARSSGRRVPEGGWRDGDIPLSDWPTAWTYPGASIASAFLEPSEHSNATAPLLRSVRTRLST
jgi:hypothetical protein